MSDSYNFSVEVNNLRDARYKCDLLLINVSFTYSYSLKFPLLTNEITKLHLERKIFHVYCRMKLYRYKDKP